MTIESGAVFVGCTWIVTARSLGSTAGHRPDTTAPVSSVDRSAVTLHITPLYVCLLPTACFAEPAARKTTAT